LQQTATLPLQKLRGQTSLIRATASSRKLTTVVCGQRSVFPALNGTHTVAASYSPHSDKLQASSTDDLENLAGAKQCFQDSNTLGTELGSGNVAIRCTTPDRLPLLGMAPDIEAMSSRFADLARNANTAIEQPGCYLPGLYISVAHGSNGLATGPFGSEYLASLICAESLPLADDMAKLLNPARFLIKNLKQQRNHD
jgi:tRNA 5-methylaminomethyl-2-thiouridine biosynthesis bifunctional protein